MENCNLSDEAREARRKYQREYKRNNPDKVRAYVERYWTKKAAKLKEEREQPELRIFRLHRQGLSLREIAAVVGINHVQVSRIIKRYITVTQK